MPSLSPYLPMYICCCLFAEEIQRVRLCNRSSCPDTALRLVDCEYVHEKNASPALIRERENVHCKNEQTCHNEGLHSGDFVGVHVEVCRLLLSRSFVCFCPCSKAMDPSTRKSQCRKFRYGNKSEARGRLRP